MAITRRGFLKAIASAPLAAAVAARLPKPMRGVAVRWIQHYNIDTTVKPTRFDVLYGVATLQKDFKVRIHG